MIEPGKVLQNRYRIDKQIGQGGMGAVYVATDERFGSTVAIKETLFMDDNYRKAIEREARLLNSLKHAALPRVSDHFLEENGQFIVMEFIPGEDLAYILEETGRPFAVDKVIMWAGQLLDALEYLHTQSMPVIHRDIKPQNLKITSQGQIVLLDFGLAKGNPTDAAGHTAAKSIFGYSRNYASLEQIQGTGTDPRSDLYSLAATLYHLATGRVPEDALTRAMAVLSGQPDPLVPANSLRQEIPAGFAAILQKALDLNAAMRPASAAEMHAMLREMEKYADLASEVSSPRTMPVNDPDLQRTKLMPGVTNQGAGRQAAVKTEVLPAYNSEETAVRPAGGVHASETASERSRRKFAAAGAGVLVLCAGLAAGAYVLDPQLFDRNAATVAAPQPVAEPALEAPQTAPASDIIQPQAGQVPAVPAAKDAPARAENEKPAAAQVSRPPRQPAANTSDELDLGMDDPELKGKTIYVGNLKIKDGKIENPEMIITEKGIVRKTAPLAPDVPADIDMRNLTPAQRRKIQIMRRRGLLPPARRVPPARRN